jgi:hypothetical protein
LVVLALIGCSRTGGEPPADLGDVDQHGAILDVRFADDHVRGYYAQIPTRAPELCRRVADQLRARLGVGVLDHSGAVEVIRFAGPPHAVASVAGANFSIELWVGAMPGA